MAFNDFDDMYKYIESIRVIKFDNQTWELSECECIDWHKNYKCDHIVMVALGMNAINLTQIIMDLPLEKKRAPGRKNATKSALVRQSTEAPVRGIDEVVVDANGTYEEDKDADEVEENENAAPVQATASAQATTSVQATAPVQATASAQAQHPQCISCKKILKKKRFFYCENHCKIIK
jgi:hypothetical protein